MIDYPYHMSARILSRSHGANAVAAAAYRSGQRLGMVVGDENGTRPKTMQDSATTLTLLPRTTSLVPKRIKI